MCLVGNGFKFFYSFSIGGISVLHILNSVDRDIKSVCQIWQEVANLHNKQADRKWYIKDK